MSKKSTDHRSPCSSAAHMNSRTRDALFLVAGLPSVATPFLPFSTGWFVSDVSPLSLLIENLSLGDSGWFFLGLAVPLFLPIVATIWQARRSWLGSPTTRERRALLCFSAFALVQTSAIQGTYVVALIVGGEGDGIGYALIALSLLLLLVAGDVALLMLNRRRRISPSDVAECFLLGAYLAHAVPLLMVFVPDLDVGGVLVAWTCGVYATTIIMRTRNQPANERVSQ